MNVPQAKTPLHSRNLGRNLLQREEQEGQRSPSLRQSRRRYD
jgi:hypothetical protein